MHRSLIPFVFSLTVATVRAGVVINEVAAAPDERLLQWNASGVPTLGTGPAWYALEFPDAAWSAGTLPAGYGLPGIATNTKSLMSGKTPVLYLRTEFTVSPADAASGSALTLSVDVNDGFVAWLNGTEIARANAGGSKLLIYHDQPAFNVVSTSGMVNYSLGAASGRLSTGRNVLAIQALNAEQPGSAANFPLYDQHLPTPEFRIDASLQITGGTTLVPAGTAWKYRAGLAEPSGGLTDPALLTGYTPPAGREADFEDPAAFSDWVELWNDSAGPADLTGWTLSDDPDQPAKWTFPAGTSIPASGYLTVLCDDREEANAPAGPASLLHASFTLKTDGEPLTLRDAGGTVVDSLPDWPEQTAFATWGRNPAAPASFGFFTTATPGAQNAGPFLTGRVKAPDFLAEDGVTPLPGGRFTGTQRLVLTSATPGATIRYTTDSSVPQETTGTVYTVPVTIPAVSDRICRVVRARAFAPGMLPSPARTNTYLINQNAALRGVPVISLTGTASQTFYKPHGVLAIQSGTYETSSQGGSVWVSSGASSYNLALGNGQVFERETHMEFYAPDGYYPDGQEPLRGDIGLRLSSSPYQRPRMKLATTSNTPWTPWWDATERPSFNLYWRGRYGRSELDYPIFPGYDVRNFDNLRLRAGKNDSGGDSPFVTDELVRRLWIDMGQVGARGLICALYVNGQWKNIGNLTERLREPMLQAHYRSTAAWDVRYVYDWVNGDSTAFNAMMSALNRNTASLTNYQALRHHLDLDNFADYYLINIYSAMWDWPGNNFAFARERSSGPDSIFRYLIWDAEGGFNVKDYYSKPVSYNTITSDLGTGGNDVPKIWQRLMLSPEWKLKVADRIQRHFFHGGVLDDRDPDGAGPAKSHFATRKDDLVSEASALVALYSQQAYDSSAFDVWTDPATGRRSYLLGTAAGQNMLRNAGLWPRTEPPAFSQHGGHVPDGYAVAISSTVATAGQSAALYYTMDGTDPRVEGGAVAPGAILYTGPVTLHATGPVMARARNTSTSEWSALTEASFLVDAVPASAANLTVSEIMYHPPGPTAAEEAAGFTDPDDFEFIRLTNIAAQPVDLAGVNFTDGVTFAFSSGAVTALNPGAHVLIVRRRAAFLARYGPALAPLIAGEFTGGLSNDGETLTLTAADSLVIRSFSWNDVAPWPTAADGDGPSLILRAPSNNPDHSDPAQWTTSPLPGGMPGGTSFATRYEVWRSFTWGPAAATDPALSGPAADPDGDGLSNLTEFALGTPPRSAGPAPLAVRLDSTGALVLSVTHPDGLSGITLTPELSPDLLTWTPAAAAVSLTTTPAGSGQGESAWRLPLSAGTPRFLRLRVTNQ